MSAAANRWPRVGNGFDDLAIAPHVCRFVRRMMLECDSITQAEDPGEGMDTASIVAALEAERDRLNSAIMALQGRGRSLSRPVNGARRTLSASAGKRISEAQKRRWGAARKKGP
jgi:hypothetical protein